MAQQEDLCALQRRNYMQRHNQRLALGPFNPHWTGRGQPWYTHTTPASHVTTISLHDEVALIDCENWHMTSLAPNVDDHSTLTISEDIVTPP
ncbi:hypothetical protein SNOG_13548 [Parastagonospora nodorum SN15]|uniref:Uncharacterized protein n=1 Tax=Phaeosphaeria nodorum (strain SN15 / ATCC MYA-4574 / FGSC 10173) TaxID=321614 RepID=Q0U3W6_PHANO|nr:hypothetical protein SNOG_13548 [Parastagonospora nodorum SN15]EAT78995.1 hypothetical protein SNOG_13548 [Parastagonospora nodorum SN15]